MSGSNNKPNSKSKNKSNSKSKNKSNKKPQHNDPQKKNVHVVLIHSNRCGYCEQLMPEWDRMEHIVQDDNMLNGKCDVVKIEQADMEKKMPRYNEMIGNREIPVAGYPTIVSIKDGNLHNYDGNRTADALVEWIKEIAERDHQEANLEQQRERNIYLGGKKSRRKRRKQSTCKSGRTFSFKFW